MVFSHPYAGKSLRASKREVQRLAVADDGGGALVVAASLICRAGLCRYGSASS